VVVSVAALGLDRFVDLQVLSTLKPKPRVRARHDYCLSRKIDFGESRRLKQLASHELGDIRWCQLACCWLIGRVGFAGRFEAEWRRHCVVLCCVQDKVYDYKCMLLDV
jgi:hypothetical protein